MAAKKHDKDWTVIGLYADNNQIWASPAKGDTPQGAARDAAHRMLKLNEWEPDRIGDILIVEVARGTLKFEFGAETPVPASEIEVKS